MKNIMRISTVFLLIFNSNALKAQVSDLFMLGFSINKEFLQYDKFRVNPFSQPTPFVASAMFSSIQAGMTEAYLVYAKGKLMKP